MAFPEKGGVILQKECAVSTCEVRKEYEHLEKRADALREERDILIKKISETRALIDKSDKITDKDTRKLMDDNLEQEMKLKVLREKIQNMERELLSAEEIARVSSLERDRIKDQLSKVRSTYELSDDIKVLNEQIKKLRVKRDQEEHSVNRLIDRQNRLRSRYQKDLADVNMMIERYNSFLEQYKRMAKMRQAMERQVYAIRLELADVKLRAEEKHWLFRQWKLGKEKKLVRGELRGLRKHQKA